MQPEVAGRAGRKSSFFLFSVPEAKVNPEWTDQDTENDSEDEDTRVAPAPAVAAPPAAPAPAPAPAPAAPPPSEAERWRAAVVAEEFSRFSVMVRRKKLPLRAGQEAELGQWASGKSYDKEWLMVEAGVPVCFVAQDGARNGLVLSGSA